VLFLKLPKRCQFQALVTALSFLCFIPAQTSGQSNPSIQGESLDQNGKIDKVTFDLKPGPTAENDLKQIPASVDTVAHAKDQVLSLR